MAEVTVICSDCSSKVTFADPTLKNIPVVGSTFDCPTCGSLMVIEKDLTTSNLTHSMAKQLALKHYRV